MIPLTDFERRSLTGPVMEEQEFDMSFAKKVREVVKRYPIKFDREQIIADDESADGVFEGGVDLLAEVGMYNRDTQRVIQLTRDEVVQIATDVWEGPREVTFGRGKEEVAITYRTAEDPRTPTIWMSTGGIPSTEELYIPYVQSFLQEELCQGTGDTPILSVGGLENKSETPAELVCADTEIKLRMEVARRVGKPGAYLGNSSATSPQAVIATCFEGGLDRYNAMIPIHLMPELKLNWGRLVLGMFLEQRGMVPWISASSIMGALCRNPEETAVAQIASLLAQLGYGHGTIARVAGSGLDGVASHRETMGICSLSARASERHVGVPMGAWSLSVAGAGTEMAFYEKAAQTVTMVASGATWLSTMGCRKGVGANLTSGLEGRLVAETAIAVSGMKTAETNELIKKIHATYADQLGSPPQGKTFPELYDVKEVQPTPEYLDVYKRAKDQLATLGVPYR
ncbi:MAG: monomethylamine:corrinoid methyltransferase [Actinobacteria bacterium]|nr:monomethylamine:corrinoid methyltransferase [Actinomycetota bacterium]